MTIAESRVVLITGAAGGLGQGLAAAFHAGGWRVAAGFHREAITATDQSIYPVQLDVTCHDQVARAVAEVLERWGRIDVLINNAAITADELLWQITDQAWNRLLEVNLKGAFLCAQAVLSVMMRQHQGHIVNISSFSGRVGQRGQASYAAAKAGLLGLTTALAREAGAADVRVNAVLPGVLLTPMTAKLSPGRLQQLANANVLGRLNSISEVAQFILFLVNTENISGQIFQLDSRIAHWA